MANTMIQTFMSSCYLPDTISVSESRQPLIDHAASENSSYNTAPESRQHLINHDPSETSSVPESRQPLFNHATRDTNSYTRKRKNSNHQNVKNVNSHNHKKSPYQKPIRPDKLEFFANKILPHRTKHESTSPGTAYVQQWLENSPHPSSLRSPSKADDVIKPSPEDSELKKFVMIQVFQRETLLKNDLMPLSDTENVEICISYYRDEQQHDETEHFRSFQLTPSDSLTYEEFPRHLGKGIRLFCNKGKEVYLKKSTTLLTFYGTRTKPEWQELKDQSNWEQIFDFQNSNGAGRDRDFKDYNSKTSCVDNVVRATVGCRPHSKHIYETDFHIKLSFVVH